LENHIINEILCESPERIQPNNDIQMTQDDYISSAENSDDDSAANVDLSAIGANLYARKRLRIFKNITVKKRDSSNCGSSFIRVQQCQLE